MKYSQYLKALEQDAPPQWRGKFLKYKELKKLLKSVSVQREVLSEDGQGSERRAACNSVKQKVFLAAVERDVTFVNMEFEYAARELIDGHAPTCFAWLAGLFRRVAGRQVEDRHPGDTERARAEEAEWCRRYAEINGISLRKILKKHDKRCGCKQGYDLLQAFWCGSKRNSASFLHSPLLEELRSLANLCRARVEREQGEAPELQSFIRVNVSPSAAPEETREWIELPMLPSLHPTHLQEITEDDAEGKENGSRHSVTANGTTNGPVNAPPPSSSAGAALKQAPPGDADPQGVAEDLRTVSIQSSHMESEDVEPEYTCPICLEVLYQPIGLDCGHRFCADCAFSASGKMYALGTVKAILDHIDPRAPCPECRTTGVFQGAHQLRETAKLIRQRYPAAWAEKEREYQEKEGRLRDMLRAQRAAEAPRTMVDRMRSLLDPMSSQQP